MTAGGRVAIVGSHGGVLLVSAGSGATTAAPGATSTPLMAEGGLSGYDSWTFWAASAAGTFTVIFFGTINAFVPGTPASGMNWFQIGQLTNASTAPLTFGFALVGVFAQVSANTGATPSAWGMVTK